MLDKGCHVKQLLSHRKTISAMLNNSISTSKNNQLSQYQ